VSPNAASKLFPIESSLGDDSPCRSSQASSPARDSTSACSTPTRRRGNQTILIFDWDDTLLCTSAINSSCLSAEQFLELQGVVESVLNLAISLGETLIVTNGNASWVQDSCKSYLPGLLPTLSRLNVISARAKYERAHPGNPFAWKRRTFKDILSPWQSGGMCSPGSWSAASSERSTVDGESGVNLVVLGDSPFEMEAAASIKDILDAGSLVKTVKFKACPSVTELLGQLGRVAEELPDLVDNPEPACKGLVQLNSVPASLAASWAFTEQKEWSCHAFSREETLLSQEPVSDHGGDINAGYNSWAQLIPDKWSCKSIASCSCVYEEASDHDDIIRESVTEAFISNEAGLGTGDESAKAALGRGSTTPQRQ